MELDRNLLIDVLIEKSEDLRGRDLTIDIQNCLMGLARADAQSLASSQRESQKAMELLKEYVECVLAIQKAAVNVNKKRRRSP